MFQNYKKLWLAIGVMIILCPVGLIATGTAFGEWGADELQDRLGFVPAGLDKLASFWSHALLPDYAIPGVGSTAGSVVGYILSAVVGVALVAGLSMLVTKLVKD